MIPGFTYDDDLVAEIAQRFDLRRPNEAAFRAVVSALADGYDPAVPLVLDLATGAGKTYVMAALVEYLRACGVRNVLVVTPSSIVQDKTVANFTSGDRRYIDGALTPPDVVTPATYDTWKERNAPASLFASGGEAMQVFVLNIQQLVAPRDEEGSTTGGTQEESRRAFRRSQETSGNTRDYLRDLEDLVVIADEHHLYSATAKAFQAAIRELSPAAVVGLTASANAEDHVIHRYSLKQAITEKFVKRPVIAFRRGGYGERGEEQQLRDALVLRQIKQQHYDAYADRTGNKRINAALFVQCADVEHATQISTLLRGPEFFGDERAVLQIDNQHSDAESLRRLRDMDQPGSAVTCVVSVNKLKEGWDVRNIAVMVTLRAMSSDVLTQQTMGRGLRLPFGRWTNSPHVDQLDVLAHASFRSLLTAEDVLHDFGLDDLIDGGPVSARADAGGGPDGSTGPSGLTAASPSPGGALASGGGGDENAVALSSSSIGPAAGHGAVAAMTAAGGAVGIVVIDEEAELALPDAPEPVSVTVVPAFAGETFTFPSTRMERQSAPFRLTRIEDRDVRDASRRVGDEGTVLVREALTFRGNRMTTVAEEDVKVDSLRLDAEQARATLLENLLRSRVFDSSDRVNVVDLETRIIPLMVQEARIETWTERTLSSAHAQLRDLISTAARAHVEGMQTVPVLTPVVLPVTTSTLLPPGAKVVEPTTPEEMRGEFVPRQYYGPWRNGLYTAASFDSFSAEYRIADLLARSTSIRWWTRLYPADGAVIAYSLTQNYHPDFVALDTDGYYWIIEGKAESGRDDAVVQAKRRAADEIVRILPSDQRFAGQRWGYVIGYEGDVLRADSWEALVAGTDPSRTVR